MGYCGRMIDVNPLRDAILAAFPMPHVDGAYSFYYDETNNVRKLHLTPGGMNIRRPDCFVLGGIVHRGPPRSIDLSDLRTLLRLQPSVKEIKLKHLGSGDFLDLLGSDKIALFLEWLPALHFGELDWQRISKQPEVDLAAAAGQADVIVAVVGINSTLESEESSITLPGFKGGDRTSLDLPADQIKLLEAARATGKPLVVVNMSGSAINLDCVDCR